MPYESNEDAGFGKKRSYATVCTSLNEQLALAIKAFELDTVFTIVRMLHDRNCVVSRKNQIFLNRFRDD